MRSLILVSIVLSLTACGGGTSTPGPAPGVQPLLTAGVVQLAPLSASPSTYELTTPAGEPFVFDVLCRSPGNLGAVRVSLSDARGGTDAGSLAEAGLVLSAAGRASRGPWLDAWGDGFARITVRGEIDEDLELLAQADDGRGAGEVVVRIRVGEPSQINLAAASEGDHPGVLDETTLYSSDSWMFGLPTIAVSGDRTSIVCYEGDRQDPTLWTRYEMRLQHEANTDVVTGGGSEEASPDSGNWRDHEIAALYNVLARAQGGTDEVTLALSFDRGATFEQVETFRSSGEPWRAARLVQVQMAQDYSLALLFWRPNEDGSTDLVLVDGVPSAYDGVGSPAAYEFEDPVVLHRVAADVTPMLMGAQWSEAGDLVVGYAYTTFESLPDRTWRSTTRNACLVRPWQGQVRDILVEEDVVVGKDPSIALLGGGDALRIFYAYEGREGVRVRTSTDAGLTFSPPVTVGDASAHMPTVFARPDGDSTIVDVLYLAHAPEGLELHVAHWDDWATSPRETHRLTRARFEPSEEPVAYGFRVTQVAWFGYDAVQDEGEIVVVYDEETYDGAIICLGAPELGLGLPVADEGFGGAPAPFVPAEPPPLAPGMTEPVPAPDPDHMHQLKLIRFQ